MWQRERNKVRWVKWGGWERLHGFLGKRAIEKIVDGEEICAQVLEEAEEAVQARVQVDVRGVAPLPA